ncbi:MAG: sulfite exporter TauE/SafE family protein [Treponema sp.]|nr:sulfite exporter TauE/SafE family protein [Treponema sp.]
MKTQMIHIRGMTCVHCQNLIEKTLKRKRGIEDAAVDFNTGTATVTWNPAVLTFTEIKKAIESLHYTVLDRKDRAPVTEIIGTLGIILALYVLLRALGINTIASGFPLAEAGMGYGMLFIIGLLTSVHCAVMCGGITLSQCLPSTAVAPPEGSRAQRWLPSILYNSGRVISYTLIGGLVGALGAAISLSGRLQGVIQLAAGGFMVIMGITMLGFFPALRRFTPRLPGIFARKIDKPETGNRRPWVIGLLNGLMPCGPLQAMQLYALSTGNPLSGAVSLFLFGLGTVPLLFGIGALSSFLSHTLKGPVFTRRVMQAGAVLVTVMGMTMLTYGFNLSGISLAFALQRPASSTMQAAETGGTPTPALEKGVQTVHSTLRAGRYPAITVQQGIPVKWIIDAPAGSINGCNNRMILREYGIEYPFRPGENVIEFTPVKSGRFPYSCWMGMIRSAITVVPEGESPAVEDAVPAPSPAGVTIPVEQAALAEIEGTSQKVRIALKDEGIEPALIVVQRGIPALWTITRDSRNPGNSRLIFPGYATRIALEPGENVLQLMPTEDFDFSTADHLWYGYVKVVDDVTRVDMEAIKAEVGAFETLVYPEAYFNAPY